MYLKSNIESVFSVIMFFKFSNVFSFCFYNKLTNYKGKIDNSYKLNNI